MPRTSPSCTHSIVRHPSSLRSSSIVIVRLYLYQNICLLHVHGPLMKEMQQCSTRYTNPLYLMHHAHSRFKVEQRCWLAITQGSATKSTRWCTAYWKVAVLTVTSQIQESGASSLARGENMLITAHTSLHTSNISCNCVLTAQAELICQA